MTNPSEPAFAFAALVVVTIAGLMTWAVVRAAQHAPPTTMIVSVALLTLLTLVGLAVTDGETASTFGTLAATGLGALTGSVVSMVQTRKDDER